MARAALSQHEAVCSERWGTIRQQLVELQTSVNTARTITVTAAGGLIVGMASLIVTLVLHK